MKSSSHRLALLVVMIFSTSVGNAYVIGNWWPDSEDIVMDIVFPAPWNSPSQFQMSEWNEVDVTDNSHPFRVNSNPVLFFGANDGTNTMGFMFESVLNSEYGLSFANALAWTIWWPPDGSGGLKEECDVVLDGSLPWSLDPDNNNWFQSTVLHELGHCRGLRHYNLRPSMQNSGQSKYLRGETLYRDDREGVRQNASNVTERDITIQNKWHDGVQPQWMTMSPTTLREGDTIQLNNIYVENRGTQSFASNLRFGVYLSTNNIISTSDQLLNTGSWSSFSTWSTFDWSATIPPIGDCSTRWIGGVIDDNDVWAERFEGNNSVAFTDGVAYTGINYTPTPLTILLSEDSFENNDLPATAKTVAVPFSFSNLSVDADDEEDWYRIVLETEMTLIIDALFDHSSGNIDMALMSEGLNVLAESVSYTDNESIWDNLASGTYYVRIRGVGSGSCNTYTLNIDTDTSPPLPNPMTWEIEPFAVSANEISMTATEATDAQSPPVGYAFSYMGSPTGGGGAVADGRFRGYRVFTNNALDANHQYCYRVRTNDRARNIGSFSETSCAYTLANLPSGPVVFSNITESSIQIDFGANGNPPNTVYVMTALRGFNLDAFGSVTDTTWTATGLNCGSSYSFLAFAENDEGVVTTESVDLGTADTLACPPVDTDGDGVLDQFDNCILVPNADQRNTDGDIYFGNMCDADFNNNNIVDPADFSLLKQRFGQPGWPDQDLDGNGIVDPGDFSRLKQMFGQPPGPSGLLP